MKRKPDSAQPNPARMPSEKTSAPTDIQERIAALFGDLSRGWTASREHAQKQLDEAQEATLEAMRSTTQRDDDARRFVLQSDLKTAQEWRDRFTEVIDCTRRFSEDRGMLEVYSSLAHLSDDQWRRFLEAAIGARRDFSSFREQLTAIPRLKDDIADAAEILMRLLREASYSGVKFPSEFERALPPLRALARAARAFEPPKFGGMIGDALSSRKRNKKTEYLRAFISLLRSDYLGGFDMTTPIMRAIAATAVVVNNKDEDLDVTYDDVRKVVQYLDRKAAEDSSPK